MFFFNHLVCGKSMNHSIYLIDLHRFEITFFDLFVLEQFYNNRVNGIYFYLSKIYRQHFLKYSLLKRAFDWPVYR